MDVEKLKNKIYIVISQTENAPLHTYTLKVFDTEEGVYKTIEMPKYYLK